MWITYSLEALDIKVIHKVIHIIHSPVDNKIQQKQITIVHIIEK